MLNAQQLRHDPALAAEKFANHKRFPITVVLDNIYDTFNIGSAFRVADAINAQKVVITGKNGICPPDKQIRKSSIHICDYFPWEYHENIIEYVNSLSDNINILSVEKTSNSKNYRTECKKYALSTIFRYQSLVLIVGNETQGVSSEILNISDSILEIPMRGIDHSMNVINALSIVGHELAHYFSGDYFND